MIWYLYILQTTHLSHMHYLFFSQGWELKKFLLPLSNIQYIIINYSHYGGHYTSMTFSFYNQKFVSFDQLCPSNPSPLTPHFWQPRIYSLYLWACFFFFLDSTYNIQSVPGILGSKLSPLTCSISMMPHMWKLSHT